MNSEWADQPQPQSGNASTPGAQMRAQREALGWSVEQASEQLKLQPRQVAALEAGDYAALPNPAVVRGFIRAYAKILKLDAAPLVATIDITAADNAEVMPSRALSASFSESRFPTLTQRSSKNSTPWIIGAVLVMVLAGAGAYKLGYIPQSLLTHGDHAASQASASATADGDKPGGVGGVGDPSPAAATPAATEPATQSASVPLISVPSTTAADTPVSAPATDAASLTPAAPAAAPTVPLASPTPAAAPDAKPAAVGANPLVLSVTQDSWIEIRRKGGAPLISRIVMAGSTETFDISEPVLLVVGKPAGVTGTLRGAALDLSPVPGGTTARLNLK